MGRSTFDALGTAVSFWVDAHCHLDLPAFDSDRDDVLQAARSLGVTGFHVPATTGESWPRIIQLAGSHSYIHFSLGYHPYFLSPESPPCMTALTQMLSQHRHQVKGVGEIGLDFAIDVDHQWQELIFEQQLVIACSLNLPVVIHHRKSHHRILALLKRTNFQCGGIIHGFSGSSEIARRYVDYGFVLGIGGTVTYPRGHKTRNTIADVGLEHLVVETDSPDMPLCGFQGMRNTPSQIPRVGQQIAQVFDIDIADVQQHTTANYIRVFGEY